MRASKLLIFVVLVGLGFSSVRADSPPANPSALTPDPWEKFSLSLGAFVSKTESSVRLGSGLGVDVDVEDVLGLDTQSAVFRAESAWRFTSNRRHRLDLSWFGFRRKATRTVGKDFDIKNQEGDTVTIRAGATLESHFNLDIIETAYSYSFIQDDRIDLAAVGGVYVMPIDIELKSTGVTDAEADLGFTAPLPVFGLRMDVALTRKWFLRTGGQFFYVEYANFTGQLMQMRAAIEYNPFKHIGIGLGVDSMRLGVEAEDEDYPRVDIKGSVDFRYTGLQLYGKLRF